MHRRSSTSSWTSDAQADTHTHVHAEGHNSFDAQIWPWRMAERLVQGIVDLRRRLRRPPTEIHDLGGDVLSSASPAVASGATDREIRREVASERARFSCKTCKRNVRADSPMHSRDPAECRYPHSVPIHWECPGCKEEKERDHALHGN